MMMLRVMSTVVAGTLVLLALTACAGTVPMTPAPSSNDPACAEVMVRLGDVAGLTKRETNAQATAAWGEPAQVLLTCGLKPVALSDQPCTSVDGVDWIMDDSDKPRYRFTTFGRTPAVEVVVDSEKVSGATVLADIATAVSQLPQNDGCVSIADTLGVN